MSLGFMEKDVLALLLEWARPQPSIRALILTSARARRDGSADELSDYDVILAVADVDRFAQQVDWMEGYGEPAARWGDEAMVLGESTYFRGVVYQDAAKVDYTIWPLTLLERVGTAARLPDVLDVGYRVLLDKDGATERWPPASYTAHIPSRPSAENYRALVEEFWWSSTYVAKALRRGEHMFARFILERDLRQETLRPMLEWRIEIDHDWSLRPGVYGRGIERLLPSELRDEFAASYGGAGIDATWESLFATAAIFRRVGRAVAEALGYRYPGEVDEVVSAQLSAVRRLPRGTIMP